MRPLMPVLFLSLLPVFGASAAQPAMAADSRPEIQRGPAAAQAVGVAHTLRTIPEACARLEGMFTGQPEQPYQLSVVRTSPTCQPRARFVDSGKVLPSAQEGWILNDALQVPATGCPTQLAVVQVWRRPGQTASPELDAQGRARIYLEDAKQEAVSRRPQVSELFAATLDLRGEGCD